MTSDTNPGTAIDRRDFLASSGAVAATLAGSRMAETQPAAATSEQSVADRVKSNQQGLKLEKAGSVFLIGINRPEAQNRIDFPTYVGLGQAYFEYEHDDALKVAVLYDVGADFSPASIRHPGPRRLARRCRKGTTSSIRSAQPGPSDRSRWWSRSMDRSTHRSRAVSRRRHSRRREQHRIQPGRNLCRGVPRRRCHGPVRPGSRLGQRHALHAERRRLECRRSPPPRSCPGHHGAGQAARSRR